MKWGRAQHSSLMSSREHYIFCRANLCPCSFISSSGVCRSTWDRLIFIAALTSWQEGLCCGALAAWALVAFTPELLTPGTGWPLRYFVAWLLMQLKLAWVPNWSALGQAIALSCFIIYCYSQCNTWSKRRTDLLALAAMRKANPDGAGHGMTISRHLLPHPDDSIQETDEKCVRLGYVSDGVGKLASKQDIFLAVNKPCY